MPPHASMLPTQPSLARSHASAPPRKHITHANHASTNSKPFFKLFQQKLGKIDPRSGNFIHSKRCMIPFLNVPLRRTISKQLTISITHKPISEQYSPSKKEWGKSSMYKLKSSQQIYFIQAFQNDRFALLEIPSRGKRFSRKDRSKRCRFLSATVHELKKVCQTCLVGKPLRVSLPLIWFELGPAPMRFSKLLQVPTAVLWRLNICLVIYLDNIFSVGKDIKF